MDVGDKVFVDFKGHKVTGVISSTSQYPRFYQVRANKGFNHLLKVPVELVNKRVICVGDLVTIKSGSRYDGRSDNNPPHGTVGEVIDIKGTTGHRYYVRWTRYENSYTENDLVLLD